MPDPVCHSKACAGHGCKRSEHRAVFDPPSWRFGPCLTHRNCERFERVGEPLPPLLPMRSPDGTERAGWPEAAHETSLPTEEVVPDGLTVETPVEAAPPGPAIGGGRGISAERVRALIAAHPFVFKHRSFLGAYDSWQCEACGSRAFESRTCCDKVMAPIRVELHTRATS
jgi:hypothetical protein